MSRALCLPLLPRPREKFRTRPGQHCDQLGRGPQYLKRGPNLLPLPHPPEKFWTRPGQLLVSLTSAPLKVWYPGTLCLFANLGYPYTIFCRGLYYFQKYSFFITADIQSMSFCLKIGDIEGCIKRGCFFIKLSSVVSKPGL